MIDVKRESKENDGFERPWSDLHDNTLCKILRHFGNCTVQTKMKSIILIDINFDRAQIATLIKISQMIIHSIDNI